MVQFLTHSHRILSVICLFLVQIPLNCAFAEDDLSVIHYIPNFVTVDIGRDNESNHSTFLYGNLGLTHEDRLVVGLGEDVQSVSGLDENLDNTTYLLGYSYIPQSTMQLGAEFERWGNSSDVLTHTLRFVFSFSAENFFITVTPEFGKITVNNNSQCDDDINSRSARLDLSFDINPEYTFNVGYVSYDYSSNLTGLGACVDNVEVLEVESKIDSVADDNQMDVGLDYFVDTETYGGNFQQAKTALYRLDYRTVTFYASTDRLDNWTLTATVGITENTDDSTTRFLSGTVTYYW